MGCNPPPCLLKALEPSVVGASGQGDYRSCQKAMAAEVEPAAYRNCQKAMAAEVEPAAYRSCQKAMAAAEVTLRESTPCAIGMRTT